MAPILGIYASQISGHLVTNSYASIQTVTVGSGGASSITFSSIPSTYTHLQIRSSYTTGSATNVWWQPNSDATSTNYAGHNLLGDGSSAYAGAGTTGSGYTGFYGYCPGTTNPVVSVMDLLDYTNTNKYKTARYLDGYNANGSGQINLKSGLWLNTGVISSFRIIPQNATNFSQYSSFALYGIR